MVLLWTFLLNIFKVSFDSGKFSRLYVFYRCLLHGYYIPQRRMSDINSPPILWIIIICKYFDYNYYTCSSTDYFKWYSRILHWMIFSRRHNKRRYDIHTLEDHNDTNCATDERSLMRLDGTMLPLYRPNVHYNTYIIHYKSVFCQV